MSYQKFVSVEEVASRIRRKIKNKIIDINDIVNWCGIVEAEYLPTRNSLVKLVDQEIEVFDYQITLPCAMFRLLRVKDREEGSLITNYDTNGVILYFDSDQYFNKNSDGNDYVCLDYISVPVDSKNRPLVNTHHTEACVAFCIKELHYEDYLMGRIDQNRWNYMESDWEYKLRGATAHYVADLDDKEKIKLREIIFNLVPNPYIRPTNID